MIRITKQSDYGILLLAHLAKRGVADEQVSARDLAEVGRLYLARGKDWQRRSP